MPAGISLTVRVETRPVREQIDSLRAKRIPAWRRRAVDTVTRKVLERTIIRNPVDTARSRSAWVTGLEQLGGVPPAGWKGPDPEAGAIAEGEARSAVSGEESKRQSERRVTNGVPYVIFLEFGTRSMAPFRMVEQSLLDARRLLGRIVPPLPVGDAE